jgi:hypothetical protein
VDQFEAFRQPILASTIVPFAEIRDANYNNSDVVQMGRIVASVTNR